MGGNGRVGGPRRERKEKGGKGRENKERNVMLV